jgi:hypothetical protein
MKRSNSLRMRLRFPMSLTTRDVDMRELPQFLVSNDRKWWLFNSEGCGREDGL